MTEERDIEGRINRRSLLGRGATALGAFLAAETLLGRFGSLLQRMGLDVSSVPEARAAVASGARATPAMSPENLGALRRGLEAFVRGDAESIIGVLDPNVVWRGIEARWPWQRTPG